jgi:hypothetical protein
MTDPTTLVPLLLTTAGLTVPTDEIADLVSVYPTLRAAADTLYSVPGLADTAPVLTFSPDRFA